MWAGTLISFVVRTRSSQRLTSGVIVAHLWWISTGRCSQSQFKQEFCLKWHKLNQGNKWGFDLSLPLHENGCTWETRCLTSTNGNTCVWQNLPPGFFYVLWYFLCLLSSYENVLVLLMTLISILKYKLRFLFSLPFVFCEMTQMIYSPQTL